MLEGEVSHDQVTRFLSAQEYTSKDLWQQVKPTVRSIERDDGVLIFDDTICDHDLQKTVASGGVSQILEVQCQPGQVPHANGAIPKQSCLYGHLRHLQARMLEHYQQAQPLWRFVESYSSTHRAPPMPSFSCSGPLRNISM